MSYERKTYFQEYYQKHREEIVKRVRDLRNSDPEAFRQKQREYRANNKEKVIKREREYYHNNKDRILERKRESQRIRGRVYYWQKIFDNAPTRENAERLRQAQQDLQAFLDRRLQGQTKDDTVGENEV